MKEKNRIIITTISVIIIQFIVSYFAYIQLDDNSVAIKVGMILFINYIIVAIAAMFLTKSYTSLFLGVGEIYSKYKINSILYDLLKQLASIEETAEIYPKILRAAIEAIPSAKYGSIIMSDFGRMKYEAAVGFELEYLKLLDFNINETILYLETAGKMNRPIIVPNILYADNQLLGDEKLDLLASAGVDKVKSTITAPIIINNAVVGALNLDSDQLDAFNERDLETIDLFALEVGKFVHLNQILEINRNMSKYDELTKVYNRGYCKRIIKEKMQREVPFILVSCDLNNLKAVNDLYGHDIGDILITSFTDNMKLFLPDNTIFSRYGGDEFIIVFTGKNITEVNVILQDALNYFDNYIITDSTFPISVSFCYGISEYPYETNDYDQLLKLSDERMYVQKREYKDKR